MHGVERKVEGAGEVNYGQDGVREGEQNRGIKI